MDVELAVAGLGCFVLALGHATTGLRWDGWNPGGPLWSVMGGRVVRQ
jgi:hypothetical protein